MSNSGFAFEPSEYWLFCDGVLPAPKMKQVRNGIHLTLLALALALLASSLLAQSAAAALQGDVNGDCKVNILDLAAVGLAFGSTSANSSGNWNPAADVKADGIINIFDLASVGLAYGDNCTASTIIDIEWRLNSNYSNVFYLADKDSLDPNVTNVGIWEAPYGSVLFENGDFVPADWKLFFYDNGGQPAGVYSIVSEGAYGTNVFGDNPDTTGLDEGISMGAIVKVLAQSSQNRFFDALFLKDDVPADLKMFGMEGGTGQYDVRVTNTEIP